MIYDITHRTTYRFTSTVRFGPHRLLFRPRDGHDMRVLATALEIAPPEQRVDLVHDVYGNSVALIQPAEQGRELSFVSRFTVDHTGTRSFEMPAGPAADAYPPSYSNAERLALQPYLLPSFDDSSDNQVADWARAFFQGGALPGAGVHLRSALAAMTQAIRDTLTYTTRDAEGIQAPLDTLRLGSGSCRDFATLMIEGLRHMGVAARFVSGYVHTPHVDGGSAGHGATHAWLQAYIPECGWVPFDPTNNLTGGSDLIQVAVSRDGKEVPPLAGSWIGDPQQYIGMEVEVLVTPRGLFAPLVEPDPAPASDGASRADASQAGGAMPPAEHAINSAATLPSAPLPGNPLLQPMPDNTADQVL